MTAHERASFSAGQECGARTAAVVARLAAFELVGGSRWWNRRRHRLMARALVAFAEELELAADQGATPGLETVAGASPRLHRAPVPPGERRAASSALPA